MRYFLKLITQPDITCCKFIFKIKITNDRIYTWTYAF